MFSVSKIITILPEGWQEKADELGIIKRKRELKYVEDLMLLALFHVVNGSTLIEVSEIARNLQTEKRKKRKPLQLL